MKIVFAIFIMCFSFSALAAKTKKPAKSTKPAKVEEEEKVISPEEKDFFFLCESSKFAKSLKKSGLFDDENERFKLVAKMQKTFIKTMDVKEALQAATGAGDGQQVGILQRAAKEAGIKKWNCPTAGDLFK
jgi:hypothetical protein